ncbi:flavin reductase [Pueribacillus theae]|uniref:Flavin reductase n=1 Tax=Pueribacillus theae TaxID=2171751 RepID=A0A2U1K6L6_9BACI|nr:flavin reductase family protein [Pueribacillus theae]PWA12538.1 flavin reductase [Pueribacillus theae]
MNFDSREFRNAMGRFSTGVTVITVKGEEDVHAMTANAFSSVSLEPPIILICIDHRAKCLDLITKTGYFGVNFLKAEQINISKLFANQKVNEKPEFSFEITEEGVPLLDDALANLKCKVVKELEMGDHTVFFGEVLGLKNNEGSPLCFFQGKYRQLAENEAIV